MHRNIVLQRRKKLKLTQDQMADKLKISRQHYNAVENFKKPPSVELAKNIATILHMDWTIFFANEVNKQAT